MANGDLEASLHRLGLVRLREKTFRITPLTGGVSSDISLVEAGGRRFCVKRALARLKVAALWEAPVERNAAEAAYLRAVARWLPHAVPHVLAEDPDAGLFAMDYLPPERFPLWKAELLAGRVDRNFAAAVGRDLALIHSKSAAEPEMRKAFAHDETFEAIRIEPYLRATAQAHPALAARLETIAATTLSTKRALVHGDVSPKNILIGPDGPVFLDAECAWFGDPAFDIAFCLNHLLLKGAREGAGKAPYLAAFAALAGAYLDGVDWEERARPRGARRRPLAPALFLARVDGKSPVEYLTSEGEREAVRRCATPLIATPPQTLAEIAEAWEPHAMSDPVIQSLIGRRVWDSRGRPTVEAEIALSDGAVGRAIAPAGASRGSREAVEKRDGGARLGGLDVRGALAGIRMEIAPALIGADPFDQAALDTTLVALDGTDNLSRLGGNALTAVSLAALHAAAASRGLPLWRHLAGDGPALIPLPEIQIFGGGAHAGRRTDVQDFMVVAPRARTFAEALETTAEVYHSAGQLMAERGLLMGVADEGGWWPAFASNEQALDALMLSIERAGLTPGDDVAISLDVAASEFGAGGCYRLGLEKRELDRDGLAELLHRLVRAISDRVDRGPVRRGRRRGLSALHGGRSATASRSSATTSSSPARPASPKPVARGKRQRGADQGQSGRHGHAGRRRLSTRVSPMASGRSSPPARARPRTFPSPISRSAGARGSSRSARSRAPSGWRNGTRFCASRKRWAQRRASPGSTSCLRGGGPGRGARRRRREPRPFVWRHHSSRSRDPHPLHRAIARRMTGVFRRRPRRLRTERWLWRSNRQFYQDLYDVLSSVPSRRGIVAQNAGAAALLARRRNPCPARKIPCAFPARGKKIPCVSA